MHKWLNRQYERERKSSRHRARNMSGAHWVVGSAGCCCCCCCCCCCSSGGGGGENGVLPVTHCWRDCDTVNRSVKRSPSLVSGDRGRSSSTELLSGVPPAPCPGRMSICSTSQSPHIPCQSIASFWTWHAPIIFETTDLACVCSS